MARVHRKLNQFDEAERLYEEAGELAERAGDRHSVLLSRIGRANVALGRGNLPQGEQILLSTLGEAQRLADRDAEARAEHGLGAVSSYRGQPHEAVRRYWRAFQLYPDEASRTRALTDVGMTLLALGDHVAAEQALSEAVRRGVTADGVMNATVELMHCASFRRDRIGFARWRERCEEQLLKLPPNIKADFYLKLGIGNARFGQFRRAELALKKALEIALAHRLHEFEFRIERILGGLKDCELEVAREASCRTEPVVETPELREVSESLAQLGER
jgi:tetratricopeptide (TPR) repeat protein